MFGFPIAYQNDYFVVLKKSILKVRSHQDTRFYDSEIGRFLSLDPLAMEFSTLSGYNYVLGNPIKFTDPDGKAPEDKIIVNADGLVTKVIEQEGDNVFEDENGNELEFNDWEDADGAYLKKKKIYAGDRLYHNISDDQLSNYVTRAGYEPLVYNLKAMTSMGAQATYYKSKAYSTVTSLSHGKADFTSSVLMKDYQFDYSATDFSRFRVGYNSDIMFRFGNSGELYNLFDAGNYMWGNWMKRNLFSSAEVWSGSNGNEVFSGGDTDADQKAIFDGFNKKK